MILRTAGARLWGLCEGRWRVNRAIGRIPWERTPLWCLPGAEAAV